jgi:hypothetical protein
MQSEDKDLSQNKKIKRIDNYSDMNLISDRQSDSTFIKNSISPIISLEPNKNNNKSTLSKNGSKNLINSTSDEKSALDKIVFSYKIRLLTSAFRKFKKMKEEAHKIIIMRKNLKEKRDLFSMQGNDNFIVDLFPSENYNHLGSIFCGKEDGFGIQYFQENNAKFVGKFINGRRVVFGYFEDKSKCYIYKGEVKNNFTGLYGIYDNYEKNIKYEGEWLNNRKDGIGIEIYQDGSKYMGEHKNGVRQGLGTYYWADGSMYEGEWKLNLMDGYGIYKFKDGIICSGFWASNKMNGFGKYIFPGVKCYIGFFEQDYKNGLGLIFWFKERKAFIGYWKENKQDGLGKFINNDRIRYGNWKQGVRERKIEEYEFYNLLNEQNTHNNFLNYFELDYDGLKDLIEDYNFF